MRKKGLAPVVDQKTRVLILGSFPGEKSLQKREYYARRGNKFWETMSRLLGFNNNLPYRAKLEKLLQKAIGLWDMVESCERDGSRDTSIRNPHLNDFTQLFKRVSPISKVYINGSNYATRLLDKKLWEQLQETLRKAGVEWEFLPSTSGARAMTPGKKTKKWSVILTAR